MYIVSLDSRSNVCVCTHVTTFDILYICTYNNKYV